jgi:membrane protein implicated in regulation of membrane protease activity
MAAITIYHALLLVAPTLPLIALTVESLAFALIVVFVGFMVRLHYRRLRNPQNEVSTE